MIDYAIEKTLQLPVFGSINLSKVINYIIKINKSLETKFTAYTGEFPRFDRW